MSNPTRLSGAWTPRFKRIIEGVTYDTQTATQIYLNIPDDEDWPDAVRGASLAWAGLYQTRHGAFFEVCVDHDGENSRVTPLTDVEAQKLVEKHANHLVEQLFGEQPELGSAERRLTVRLPVGLARRVEDAAKARDVNVNAYIMRALEQAVSTDGLPRTFD
jgi:predicted DNA binding CopG/RHH family protein